MGATVREGSIGSILFKSQIITEADIDAALAEQGRSGCRFGEALVSLGVVTQEDIDWALSNQLDIPYVRINAEMIDPAAVALVPARLARKHGVMPLIRVGEELRVVMADPLDREGIAAVEETSGCCVSISMGLIREIREMHDHFYGHPSPALLDFTSPFFTDGIFDGINGDTSGKKLIEALLSYAARSCASSVSILPLRGEVKILARHGDEVTGLGSFPASHGSTVCETLARMCGSENGLPQEATLRLPDGSVSFSVLAVPASGGSCITFMPTPNHVPPASAEGFGFVGDKAGIFTSLAAVQKGLILASSPETRVLPRLVRLLTEEQDGARTGFLAGEGFGTTESLPVCPSSGDTPSGLLRTLFRHAPMVVGIAEVKDVATLAVAAEGGERLQVAAGMCGGRIPALLRRLLHYRDLHRFYPLPLKGIVAASPLGLLCPECRQPVERPAVPEDFFPSEGTFVAKIGCPACRYSGYRDILWLAETLVCDEEFLQRFAAAESPADLLREGRYLCSDTEVRELVCAGEVDPSDYLSWIME